MEGSELERKVVEALKKGLLNLWEEESLQHVRKEGVYYPSAIGSCVRKQFYMYTIGERPSSEKLAIFATGKGVHNAVAEALNASKLIVVESEEVETDLKVTEEVTLKGRIDVLVAKVNGSKAIIEVKSTSHLPENPYENHLLQLQTYLHATGIEDGVLLYWDKRRGNVKAFAVKKDEKYMQKLAERTIILHEHIKKEIPPLKEAILEGRLWECDVCEFNSICNPFLLDGITKGEPVVIVTLDGVILDDEERKRYALSMIGLPPSVDPKELRGRLKASFLKHYFDPLHYALDRPKKDTVDELWRYRKMGRHILILSERPEEFFQRTREEVERLGIPYDAIILRPENHPMLKWKLDTLKRLSTNYKVELFMDNDERVMKPLSKLGLPVKILKRS
jgi:CRISPR/Cas system-associated exonuclease Cas4 (RecB family)